MKNYFLKPLATFILMCMVLFANAQQAKIKVAYSWLFVKAIHVGIVQINPETGEQASGVSYRLSLVIKLKNGVTPNFTEAIVNNKAIAVDVQNKGQELAIGESRKSAKQLQINTSKNYTLWEIIFKENIATVPEQGALLVSLKYPNKKLHYFNQTPIFVNSIPAE